MKSKLAVILATFWLLLAISLPVLPQGGPNYRRGTPPAGPLTEAEVNWLRLMREEEKLARDVYQNLYETHKLTVFSNISQSEQRHFDAIGRLLERYGVADPASGQLGAFTNPELQKLYNELISKGQTSAVFAFEVGVTIEEVDIKDLEEAIVTTSKIDIKRVYSNLLSGSLNHLAAFRSHSEMMEVNP